MTARQWSILVVLMAAEMVSGFEASMVLAGLSSWGREFGDPVAVGWIVTAYLIVSASASALCGRLGDLFGRRTVLVAVILLACLGSVISAVGPGLGWIVAGRAIQGFAGAIIPLCYGLAREYLPKDRVALGVGLIVATASVAAALGVLSGGLLTDHYGAHSIFVLSAIGAFLIAMLVAFALPRSASIAVPGKLDWLGGILFAPAIALLLLGVSNGRVWGWSNPLVIGLLAGGIVILAGWYVHERRQAQPLIDVRLLTHRDVLLGNLVMAFAAVGIMQLTQLTAMLLQQAPSTGVGLGTSATLVGLLKFPALTAGLVSSVWAGAMSGRRGGRFPIVIGSTVMVAATSLALIDHGSTAIIVVVVTLGNMGVTALYAGVPTVIMAASPAERTAEATGLMVVIRSIAQAVGAQLLAVFLATSPIVLKGKIYPSEFSYQLAFGVMTLASAGALVFAVLLPRRVAKAHHRTPPQPSSLADDRAAHPA